VPETSVECKLKNKGSAGSFSGANSQMNPASAVLSLQTTTKLELLHILPPSKRRQTIPPLLDAEPQLIMDLSRNKVPQTIELFTPSLQNSNSKI
jgi:hypothetical protein